MRLCPRNFPVATVSPTPKGNFTRVEVSALKHAGMPGLHGRSPLLRLQSDERLVALIRRGNHGAFEALVEPLPVAPARVLPPHARLPRGCRGRAAGGVRRRLQRDAGRRAPDQPAAVAVPHRPQPLLNHLRRTQAIGVDSMDVHFAEHGHTTADKVHKREDFRLLIADVQDLPETQRTALLLREIDALSYDQIAEAMDTTVPSVKSLLVRARVSLAEAPEARRLSCEDVRLELGEVAEGLSSGCPRRCGAICATCDRCAAFPSELRDTNKALAAIFPVGPLLLFKKLVLAHLGTTASGGGATAASSAGASAAGSAAASSAISAGVGAVASKAAAGVAAAAIVTAGAVEVRQATVERHSGAPVAATLSTGGVAAPASTRAPRARALVAHRAKPNATHKASRSRPRSPPTTTKAGDDRAPPAPAPAPEPAPAAQPAAAAHADRDQRRHAAAPRRRDRAARRLGWRHERRVAGAPILGRPRRRRRPRPDWPGATSALRRPRRRTQLAARRSLSRSRAGYPAADVISLDDFQAVDMRVGRVLAVEDFPEARRPAWKLEIDFGPEIGVKRSSAQIKHYAREALEGRLVVGVVNFPPLRMGQFKSEVLVLGALDDEKGVVLLAPDEDVAPGDRIA